MWFSANQNTTVFVTPEACQRQTGAHSKSYRHMRGWGRGVDILQSELKDKNRIACDKGQGATVKTQMLAAIRLGGH